MNIRTTAGISKVRAERFNIFATFPVHGPPTPNVRTYARMYLRTYISPAQSNNVRATKLLFVLDVPPMPVVREEGTTYLSLDQGKLRGKEEA